MFTLYLEKLEMKRIWCFALSKTFLQLSGQKYHKQKNKHIYRLMNIGVGMKLINIRMGKTSDGSEHMAGYRRCQIWESWLLVSSGPLNYTNNHFVETYIMNVWQMWPYIEQADDWTHSSLGIVRIQHKIQQSLVNNGMFNHRPEIKECNRVSHFKQ